MVCLSKGEELGLSGVHGGDMVLPVCEREAGKREDQWKRKR